MEDCVKHLKKTYVFIGEKRILYIIRLLRQSLISPIQKRTISYLKLKRLHI